MSEKNEALTTAADAAAFIERKAEEFARDFGYSDMGSLSFGSGDHAQVKMDHYTSLTELAEEIRALAASPADRAGLERREVCEVRDEHDQGGTWQNGYDTGWNDCLDARKGGA